MKTSNSQYARALYEVTNELDGADLSIAISNFVKVLSSDHKLRQADAIIKEFESISKKEQGIISIEITSARKLDESVVNKVKNVFGDKVEAVTSVDKSLMGGISVKTEDKILDGSIRTQLQNLKQSII